MQNILSVLKPFQKLENLKIPHYNAIVSVIFSPVFEIPLRYATMTKQLD
jgi:hypothetical protein